MKTYTRTAAALLIVVLLLSGSAGAQNPVNAERKFTKTEITNLANGIESGNTGLRKSSIFMAGKYRVAEAVEALTGQLSEEKDPAVRLLIARALYEIGNYDGMMAVYELSKTDSSARVRNMSKALFNEYMPETDAEFTILK